MALSVGVPPTRDHFCPAGWTTAHHFLPGSQLIFGLGHSCVDVSVLSVRTKKHCPDAQVLSSFQAFTGVGRAQVTGAVFSGSLHLLGQWPAVLCLQMLSAAFLRLCQAFGMGSTAVPADQEQQGALGIPGLAWSRARGKWSCVPSLSHGPPAPSQPVSGEPRPFAGH